MENIGILTNSGLKRGIKFQNRIRRKSYISVEMKSDIPTAETVMAMEETMNDIKNGNIEVFYNVDEFMNDLLSD